MFLIEDITLPKNSIILLLFYICKGMQYDIKTKNSQLFIEENIFEKLESILSSEYKNVKKIILTDTKVFGLWVENLITSVPSLSEAELIQVPEGEDSKCLEIAGQIWESLAEYQVSRNDLIINLGGGVVTDLGGFIASTYKRGIPFINIPTTLLSQIDASIGGKNGIDLGPHKNMVGTFSEPKYVLIGTLFLSTLEDTELLSGYAEMLKHGLISSKKHWNNLKQVKHTDIPNHHSLIFDSITIKKDIVEADPFEKNQRKMLNFGHTAGHAIEGYHLATGKVIPHGFAVAWGIVVESYIAQKSGMISKAEWDEIYYIISDLYPKITLENTSPSALIDLMKNDKKNLSEDINFTLVTEIGKAITDQSTNEDTIIEGLQFVLS